MDIKTFVDILGADFYTGVPDSQIKALCNYLMDTYGIDPHHHLIAANEGNCTALAAGYHLATGKVPVVYMQNSGQGNIINPVASLLNDNVYAIPVIFVIGWRGQPGVHDEPQHIYQGQVTVKLMEDMDIKPFIVSEDTTPEELSAAMGDFREVLASGKSVAFIIRKNALTMDKKVVYKNDNKMVREEIIRHIAAVTGTDPIVSTTGKASRELFEIRVANGQSHQYDFLTVGSMGHTSSIALGIAINKPDHKIWCIDGAGSMLMHMGALAVTGSVCPDNLVHIVINNGAHETVGGMPVCSGSLKLAELARASEYRQVLRADTAESLQAVLKDIPTLTGPVFLEIRCACGARPDLGRPATTPQQNRDAFMAFLNDPNP